MNSSRILKLKDRTIDYTLRNPADYRASQLWQECQRDIFEGKEDIGQYEARMDALELNIRGEDGD